MVVAVIPKFQKAQEDTALNSARALRNAAASWRAARGGDECPTVAQLRADKEIDTAAKTDDPWGSQFKISCADDEVTVSSPGRDKKEGSSDDLSVPAKGGTAAPDVAKMPFMSRRPLETTLRADEELTLIELLVTVALIAIMTTGAVMGSGALVNSRIRGATTMISGAIRIAFTRASATSRPNRLVFDFESSKVILEETSDTVLVRKEDTTGGSAAATQQEKDALEQASRIVKGPQAPRARFSAGQGARLRRSRHQRRAHARQRECAFARSKQVIPRMGRPRVARTSISGRGDKPSALRSSSAPKTPSDPTMACRFWCRR